MQTLFFIPTNSFIFYCHYFTTRFSYNITWTIFGPSGLAGRVLWNRFCPSCCLSRWFLELDCQIYLTFSLVLEILIKLFLTEVHFWKNFFYQKIGPKTSQKEAFLNLKKNLIVNLFCNKYLYNSRVCAQFLFSQSDYRIFNSTISPERINETMQFFVCWYKFIKIKVCHFFFFF